MSIKEFKRKLLHLNHILLGIIGIEVPPLPTVSAIIFRKDKILAIEVSPLKYTLPGGMLKNNETRDAGLKREVWEETGLTIHQYTLVGEYACHVDYPTLNFAYRVSKNSGKLQGSAEGTPVWIDWKKNIDNFIYLDNRLALKDFKTGKRATVYP